jgi:hypothetical protein
MTHPRRFFGSDSRPSRNTRPLYLVVAEHVVQGIAIRGSSDDEQVIARSQLG